MWVCTYMYVYKYYGFQLSVHLYITLYTVYGSTPLVIKSFPTTKTNSTPNVLKTHCFRVLIILSRGLWIIIAVFPDLYPKHTRKVSIVICFPLLGFLFFTYIEIKKKKGSLWHLWYSCPVHDDGRVSGDLTASYQTNSNTKGGF